jgi:FOG: TPR repeat, SEL1 subfamily
MQFKEYVNKFWRFDMHKHFFILILTMLAFFQIPTAFAATAITGMVTEKRGDSVKVEFEPHKTVSPKIGDKVDFSTEIKGIKGIKAGTGKVTKVDGKTVWVKTSDKRPKPKMNAIIQATGNPMADASLKTGDADLEFKEVKAAYQNGDYTTALKKIRPLAEQGYAKAQDGLGNMYEKGRGIKQDYTEAVKWYYKAAKQGLDRAQYNLAVMYEEGSGVEQDYTESLKWYHKAAEQGYSYAQYNLAHMYDKGRGVEKDYTEALRWYRKAAEQGDDLAQNNLALMFENGRGVEKDYTEAMKWYYKSAEHGFDLAQYNLGKLYDYGKGVSKDDIEAIRWYRKAAAQGNEGAKKALKRLGVSD